MSQTIVVEAVSDKFKNKYNSGSVLAGGKWLQVSSKLDIGSFVKDTEMIVETKTNEKGYTSIVGLVDVGAKERVKTALKEAKESPKKTSKTVEPEESPVQTLEKRTTSKPDVSYEDRKGRKILVQGVTQACISCSALAGLPFTNSTELIELIKDVSLAMIAFVDQESK